MVMILIVVMVIPVSCKKAGLFREAGAATKMPLTLKTFDEIVLNDKINLILTYDSTEAVVVEAGKNLIDDINLTVTGNKLNIHDNNAYKWSRNLDYVINVYVSSRTLKKISYYGAGNVRMTNTWKNEEFVFDSWTGVGSADLNLDCAIAEFIIRMANADITVQGKSGFTKIYCADQGSMDLRNFDSQDIHIDYRSLRNSFVYATRFLDAIILYKGNVYYRGSPEIKSVYNSTGRLLPSP